MKLDRLKQLRKSKNMSQSDLANNLGFTQYNISDWEIGRTEPDINSITRIANFFDVSTDFLLGNDTNITNTPPTDDFQFALYGEVKDLSDEQKQYILEMAKKMNQMFKK